MKTKQLLILTILLSLFISPILAQDYTERVIVKGLQQPKESDAADIDVDGWIDMVTLTTDKELCWLKNQGDGQFDVPKVIVPNEVNGFQLFDRDADGDTDILLSTEAEGILWLENIGGNYNTVHTVASSSFFTGLVKFADIDGDGDLDVVASGGSVYWYENLGNDTYSDFVFIDWAPSSAYDLLVGDIDGDNDIDLVMPSSFVGTRVFRNMGNGEFEDEYSIGGGQSLACDMIDLDGDGDLDILQGTSNEWIGWYENDGVGNFTSNYVTNDIWWPRDIKGVDLDNDGDKDILTVSRTTQRVAWFEQTSTGVFENIDIIDNDFNSFNRVVAADFLNNGKNSVTAISHDNSIIELFKSNSNGNFLPGSLIFPKYREPKDGNLADVNNDGIKDFVFIAHTVYIYAALGICDGVFSDPIEIASPGSIGSLNLLEVGDLDGDGDQDLLLFQNYNNEKVQYALNDGNGNFGDFIVLYDDIAQDLKIADLDGDGLSDIIVMAGEFSDALFYYRNLGNGTFDIPYVFDDVVSWFGKMEIADFEGDGDLDILVNIYQGGIYTWYINEGDGTFAQGQFIDSPSSLAHPDLHDADGDGDLDIFTSRPDPWKVGWFENTGDNQFNFSDYHLLPSSMGIGSHQKTFGDFDHDGIDDLIVNNYYEDNMYWFRGLGGGTYASAELFGGNYDLVTFETSDIDLDDDDDFYMTDFLSHKIAWLQNNSITSIDTSEFTFDIDFVDTVSCFSDQTAFIHLLNTNICSEYSVSWSNPGLVGFIINDLGAGTYTYTIENMWGLTLTDSITVTVASDSSEFSYNIEFEDTVLCFDDQTAFIHLNNTNICNDHTISWSNPGLEGFIINNLGAGTYTYTIENMWGLTLTDSITVTVVSDSSEFSYDIEFEDTVLCFDDQTAFIHLNNTNICNDHTISWSNPGLEGFVINNLGAGTYIYTIENMWGLTLTDSITVSEPNLLIVQGDAIGSVSGAEEGMAWLNISGGTPPFNIEWQGLSPTTDTITGLNPGVYSAIVTDAFGCSETIDIIVDQLVATNQLSDYNEIEIYPTLISDNRIYVHVSETIEEIVNIKITDQFGQVLKDFKVANLKNGDSFIIQELPAGVYYFIVRNEENLQAVKSFIVLE